jgi:hypothetical protein
MLTRSQLKRRFLAQVSEPVVTGVLNRLVQNGWLGVQRLHGNGVQILWLTKKGRDLLVESGVPALDLFPAAGPAAAKDFAHTAEIANVAIWLAMKSPAPDEMLPAWQLQRLFGGQLTAIPDLVALWKAEENGNGRGIVLAVEVDLGTEPLESIFVPKLRTLVNSLMTMFEANIVSVLALVPTERRADALRKRLPEGMPMMVDLLAVALPKS